MQHFYAGLRTVGFKPPKLAPTPLWRLPSYHRHTDPFPVPEFSEQQQASSGQVNKQAFVRSITCVLSYLIFFFQIVIDLKLLYHTAVLPFVSTRCSSS